jgi:polyhydroxybutyrate depolymerase
MSSLFRIVIGIAIFSSIAAAQTAPTQPVPARPESPAHSAAALAKRTWTIEGTERTALVYIPSGATQSATPVVFAFHGHGGSARQASNSFHIHTEWPEAIVVYMEGLPTVGALIDPEGKRNGWQNREGIDGDRDLKFFDAVLASLKKDYKVDDRRIYAMGHSNGGGFTYMLWSTRASVFAAFAPSGAFTLRATNLSPKPAMHIAGKTDELVKFPYQERTIDAVKKVNGCSETGEPWAKDCTKYASKTGTPLITLIYDGGHKYPSEAPALIVKFFKEVSQPGSEKPADKPTR